MKSRILITGGAGYIGSVLSQSLLREGYAVSAFDLLMHSGEGVLPLLGDPFYTFTRGDIRDVKAVRPLLDGIEAVVHLAAIVGDPAGQKNPSDTVAINRDATKQLVDMARDAGVKRFIFFSTCSNYGISEPGKLSSEDTQLNPISLYAQTKVEAEGYVRGAATGDFMPVVLRMSTVFGPSPRMRFDLTVNQFVAEALRDKKLVIFAPNAWRPYIHIRDVADCVRCCLEAEPQKIKGEVYNAGANNLSHTKSEIAQIVARLIPGTAIEIGGQGSDRRDYRVDFGKWKRVFPCAPTRTVEDGTRQLISLLDDWKIIADPWMSKYANA